MGALAIIFSVLIGAVTLRRVAFVLAPARRAEVKVADKLPSVVVAVAARNEEGRISDLLAALDRLSYAGPLSFLFVDDASTDSTPDILRSWTDARSRARLLVLEEQLGKAQALNTALLGDDSDFVYCLDADQQPAPKALALLTDLAASDPQIGAVCGYRRPIYETAGAAARYAALEAWVHQLVVLEGKDRWRLNPSSSGGNTLFRRAALNDCDGFPAGSLSEDTEITLAMVARGWTTRFLRSSQADTQVPTTIEELRRQRARWTVGLYRSGRNASGLESLLTSFGYADRIILIAATICTALGYLPLWLPAAYFIGPLTTVPLALYRAGVGLSCGGYLFAALRIFPLDAVWTLRVTLDRLLRPNFYQQALRGWRSS